MVLVKYIKQERPNKGHMVIGVGTANPLRGVPGGVRMTPVCPSPQHPFGSAIILPAPALLAFLVAPVTSFGLLRSCV